MSDRAKVFVDGNNWYHGLVAAGADPGRVNLQKVSEKIVGPREWLETRYYVGQVSQEGRKRLYADQRRYLARLQTLGRISVHLGRIEKRIVENEAAKELRDYLYNLPFRIERTVFRALVEISKKHAKAAVYTEKAVDVMLAVDMVLGAERDEFDAAYILSADGDYTPAVVAVRAHGKKVYAASPLYGAQLASEVDSFISLDLAWLSDCYGGF